MATRHEKTKHNIRKRKMYQTYSVNYTMLRLKYTIVLETKNIKCFKI